MKQSLKRLAIDGLASGPASWLMSPLLNGRASIFMLHRFRSVECGLEGHDPAFIRACLAELRRRRAQILSLDQLVSRAIAGEPINGAISFTMDDGFWDQGEIGAEIFLEYDVPVTCFLITGLQDGLLWPWDDRLAYIYERSPLETLSAVIAGRTLEQDIGQVANRRQALRDTRALLKTLPFATIEPALAELAGKAEVVVPQQPPALHRPLGWDLARQLEQRGVHFGPHSVSHGIVARMTDDEARHELLLARDRLKQELDHPLDIYGWPTGRKQDFSARDIAILRGAGFRAAVATDENYAAFPPDPCGDEMYALRRFGMPANLPDMLQYSSWIERAKQRVRGGERKNTGQV